MGAAGKSFGACPRRAVTISPTSLAARSGTGGSSMGSESAVPSATTSESSRGLLLGPSSVGLRLRGEDAPVISHQRKARGATSTKKSKTHLCGRFDPEKYHLCSARPSKTPDQDGDPASSTASARGSGTHSDTCSESGNAGRLAVTRGRAALEPGGFPADAAEGIAPTAPAVDVAASSSSSSSEDHGSSREASP